MKFILIILISITEILAEDQSFREKIKAKLKERLEAKMQSKPAPQISDLNNQMISKTGEYVFKLTVDGISRYYKLYVPKNFSTSLSLPLIFSFHGGGGDMNIQSDDKFYKLKSKADLENFLVIFPNGYSKFQSGKLATWNAGKCCGQAKDQKIDDIKFVKEIFNDLNSKIQFDKSNVFAIGMSNGAMMSYRLACELPDLFKAVGAVAGTDNTEICEPKKSISVMHIHAKDDDHVLYNGGIGAGAVNKEFITDFKSVNKTIEEWKTRNKCSDEKKNISEGSGFQCFEYGQCASKTKVRWCVTDTGGHSWPGGEKPRSRKQNSKSVLSANDELWNFFRNL